MTVEKLAQLLKDARRAHQQHELDTNQVDPDWATWSAEWLLPRLTPAVNSRNYNDARGGMKL